MRIYRAGSSEVAVSDGTLSTESPLSITVFRARDAKFVLAAESTTPAVGAADDLTITAQDTYGNPITALRRTKSLTFAGAHREPRGARADGQRRNGEPVAFGTSTPIDFKAGVATVDGSANGEMRLYKPGLPEHHRQRRLASPAPSVKVTPVVGSAGRIRACRPTVAHPWPAPRST